jgi:hypothetical protein
MDAGAAQAASRAAAFRKALVRALCWSMLAKLTALLLLWWLCFAGHAPPTPAAVSRHLHLPPPAQAQRDLTDG